MINRKVAVVTGGARGIGLGISKKLVDEGYALALMGTSHKDKISEVLNAIKDKGNPVLYFQGDISSLEDQRKFVKEIMSEFGRVDLLVNNAGIAPPERMDILNTTEENYDAVMGINLKGTFFLTQLIAGEMIKLCDINEDIRPIIINISSISSYTSSYSRGEYCISKAGLSMMTKLFADRLAEYGIYVYEISPGIIRTDMTNKVRDKYDNLIEEGLIPIKRWGYPEDIANSVIILASGKLSYSTGQVIHVDGGFHLRRL